MTEPPFALSEADVETFQRLVALTEDARFTGPSCLFERVLGVLAGPALPPPFFSFIALYASSSIRRRKFGLPFSPLTTTTLSAALRPSK